ncbi:MAG: alpha/beta hydrolase [Victivallales bacterium]|nr:alpha/beta hydrolase [Victivallales bacterium]
MNPDYLFLPGWAVPPDYYRRLQLTDGAAAAVVDYGFFTPESVSDPRSAGARAAAVTAPTVVLAHSLGTLFALRAAAENRHIAALILFAPFPRFTVAADYSAGCPLRELRAMRLQLRRQPETLLRHFYAAMGNPETVGFEPGAVLNVAALEAGLAGLAEEDVRSVVPRVGCPVLLLQGENDVISGTGGAAYLAARLPQVRLQLFPGAGHALPFTRTGACREVIGDFLLHEVNRS